MSRMMAKQPKCHNRITILANMRNALRMMEQELKDFETGHAGVGLAYGASRYQTQLTELAKHDGTNQFLDIGSNCKCGGAIEQ